MPTGLAIGPGFELGFMDTEQILRDLRQRRDQLNEAILAFERLVAGAGPRRVRQPKWLAVAKTADAPKGRPGMQR